MNKFQLFLIALASTFQLFSQNDLKFELNFTKKINSEISLYRLRERTAIKIINADPKTIKAKLIFRVERGNELIYQTSVHQAPILRISEGENYFEGDIIISNEASHIVLQLDSSVHISYDLFYVKEAEVMKHLTLQCSIEKNEDETVSFNGEEIMQENNFKSFEDLKTNLKDKYLANLASINTKNVSESAIAYFQMQQAMNMISDSVKVRR